MWYMEILFAGHYSDSLKQLVPFSSLYSQIVWLVLAGIASHLLCEHKVLP
jgi:hypothetical protein